MLIYSAIISPWSSVCELSNDQPKGDRPNVESINFHVSRKAIMMVYDSLCIICVYYSQKQSPHRHYQKYFLGGGVVLDKGNIKTNIRDVLFWPYFVRADQDNKMPCIIMKRLLFQTSFDHLLREHIQHIYIFPISFRKLSVSTLNPFNLKWEYNVPAPQRHISVPILTYPIMWFLC